MDERRTPDRDLRAARGRLRESAKPDYGAGLSTRSWDSRPTHLSGDISTNVTLECGWGRLIFGQTFASHEELLEEIAKEEPGRRDICLYAREPHVLVSHAPQELFIDPSHTYRLWLHQHQSLFDPVPGVVVRDMASEQDATAVNRIYTAAGMVTAPPEVMWANQRTATFIYLVAEDAKTGEVIGTVTGVDHRRAFADPEEGSSLWCLAVDLQASQSGIGQALVRVLADRFKARGLAFLDLSVVHDNQAAIALYEKLGFVRVPVYAVKRKNPINEPLFTEPQDLSGLNPYARIIADEAIRRGITVEVLDAEWGEMDLSHGGRKVRTRESLSELTTAVAMSRCDDKHITRKLLQRAGLRVPRGILATDQATNEAFLAEVGEVVVKPSRAEQGLGITVGVTDPDRLAVAIAQASRHSVDVLLEELIAGDDLRVVVIDDKVAAAAIRKPAEVTGDGRSTLRTLIERQSRRREVATGGESTIPLDEVTRETLQASGYDFDDVPADGVSIRLRRTANLHTGGTLHDVTDKLHPTLAEVAIETAQVIGIPVVGVDLLIKDVTGPEHVIIEANERPGLANHEPQPVVERFIDLLFPQTRSLPAGWRPN